MPATRMKKCSRGRQTRARGRPPDPAGALHDVEGRREQHVAAEREDHRGGVQRAEPSEARILDPELSSGAHSWKAMMHPTRKPAIPSPSRPWLRTSRGLDCSWACLRFPAPGPDRGPRNGSGSRRVRQGSPLPPNTHEPKAASCAFAAPTRHNRTPTARASPSPASPSVMYLVESVAIMDRPACAARAPSVYGPWPPVQL